MKSKIFLIVLFFSVMSFAYAQGAKVVGRDGILYRTVLIGTLEWTAENMQTKSFGSLCYKGKKEKCRQYGRLYGLGDFNHVCPEGWRLPSVKDWAYLYRVVDGNVSVLKDESWKQRENENNSNGSGFSAKPNGFALRFFGGIESPIFFEGQNVSYLTSDDSIRVMLRDSLSSSLGVVDEFDKPLEVYSYARCVRGELPDTTVFFDQRDGKEYKLNYYGDMAWFAENLAFESRNSKCFKDEAECKKYGRFYNYYEKDLVCPEGSHLPSRQEWERFHDYDVNYEGKGESSFGIVYSGRIKKGKYDYMGLAAHFWSNENNYISFDRDRPYLDIRRDYSDAKNRAMSVRCVTSAADVIKMAGERERTNFNRRISVEHESLNQDFSASVALPKESFVAERKNLAVDSLEHDEKANSTEKEQVTADSTENVKLKALLKEEPVLSSSLEVKEPVGFVEESNTSKIHWIPIGTSLSAVVAGSVVAIYENVAAKNAYKKGASSAEEYQDKKKEIHNAQTGRTIGSVIAILGAVGLGISIAF